MAKRVPPLSAAAVAKIRPDPLKTLEFVDGDVAGLRLRVSPKGARTWSLNIRANGVMRRFEVGKDLGLAEARTKARGLRQQVSEGFDPTKAKRANRERTISAMRGIGSFGAVIDAYFAEGNGAALKTKGEQSRRIKSIFKLLLVRPAMEVTSAELQRAIDAHGAKVAAARAVGYVVPAIKWATKRGLMQGPFDLEKPLQGPPRQRVLSMEELSAILPALNDAYGRCCLFMLLTGARLDEACNARWSDIDRRAAFWIIPPEARKDTRSQGRRRVSPKQELRIPLSRQALTLLDKAQDAEVARRTKAELPDEISPDDLIFAGPQGGKLVNWHRWLKATSAKTGVSGWSAHALRRTAATLAGETGAAPHVVSVLLGHTNVGGQLVAGYNKSRYQSEHAKTLQDIANLIEALPHGVVTA